MDHGGRIARPPRRSVGHGGHNQRSHGPAIPRAASALIAGGVGSMAELDPPALIEPMECTDGALEVRPAPSLRQ